MTEPAEHEEQEPVHFQVDVPAAKIDTKTAWSLIIVVASCLLISIVSVIYSTHVSNDSVARARENTRQFCSLMQTLDGAYRAQPPPTDTGKLVATEVHNLVIALGCTDDNTIH